MEIAPELDTGVSNSIAARGGSGAAEGDSEAVLAAPAPTHSPAATPEAVLCAVPSPGQERAEPDEEGPETACDLGSSALTTEFTEATHENTAASNLSGQEVDATRDDSVAAVFSGPGVGSGAAVALAIPRAEPADATASATSLEDASASQSPSLPLPVGVPTLGTEAAVPAEATPRGRCLRVVAFEDLVSSGLGRPPALYPPLPINLPSAGSADVSIGAGVSEAPLRRAPPPPEPAEAPPAPLSEPPPSTHPARHPRRPDLEHSWPATLPIRRGGGGRARLPALLSPAPERSTVRRRLHSRCPRHLSSCRRVF